MEIILIARLDNITVVIRYNAKAILYIVAEKAKNFKYKESRKNVII